MLICKETIKKKTNLQDLIPTRPAGVLLCWSQVKFPAQEGRAGGLGIDKLKHVILIPTRKDQNAWIKKEKGKRG